MLGIPAHLKDSDVLKATELAAMLGVQSKTIARWSRWGLLPQPSRLSRRILRYSVGQVRAALVRMNSSPAPAETV